METQENKTSPDSAEDKPNSLQNDCENKLGDKKDYKKIFFDKLAFLANRWFIDGFSGMALGLFCTLIAGTILAQIASWFGDSSFATTLTNIAKIAKMLMGAGIGVGIAVKLKAHQLVVFSAGVTGLIGAFAGGLVDTLISGSQFSIPFGVPGNPIGSFVVAVFTIELASLYAGKTKIDIVLIPLGMLFMSLLAIFVAWPFIKLIDYVALAILLAIEAGVAVKILVGIFVAVVMGILLTMPTSSAAIWIAIAASAPATANPDIFAIAGGAAVAGCSAHMIGFAVASFRENKWSGIISQGIGTSMLQIPNIIRKPQIMIPEIIASAFCGLTAVLFGLRCNPAGGGMGTSGLVGVFGTIDASTGILPSWQIALGIIICLFILPALISLGVSELMRHYGFIKFGDMQLKD